MARRSPEAARQTREAILRAGLRALAEVGYRRASIRAIARGAGVSHGAVQRHFPSKQALFEEVVANLFVRVGPRFPAEVQSVEDPEVALRRFASLWTRLFEEDADSTLLARTVIRNPELYAVVRAVRARQGPDPGRTALVAILQRLAAAGRITPLTTDDPRPDAILALLTGVAYQRVLGVSAGPPPAALDLDRVIDIVVSGVVRPAG